MPYYKAQQESVAEEQRKIKEKADRYDVLVNTIGYLDFVRVMKEKIDSEIAEATKCNLEPQKQTLHVIRWNAMREVLDAAENDILETRKERDRIKQEEYEYLHQQYMQERLGEFN